MFSHCTTGGWILGNTIDGTQAEYVRTPHADTSLYPIPDGADEEALVMLSDILPTGFECGVLNGKVQPGSTVAIVGSGPIGLAALLTAQFYSPGEIIMIDLDDNRLEVAKRFGATQTINSTDGNAVEALMKLTGGRASTPPSRRWAFPRPSSSASRSWRPGGVIANIGVHGAKVDLHLERLWDRNISITTRLVDTASTPMLLKVFKARKIDPKLLITHRFKLDDILRSLRDLRQRRRDQGAEGDHRGLTGFVTASIRGASDDQGTDHVSRSANLINETIDKALDSAMAPSVTEPRKFFDRHSFDAKQGQDHAVQKSNSDSTLPTMIRSRARLAPGRMSAPNARGPASRSTRRRASRPTSSANAATEQGKSSRRLVSAALSCELRACQAKARQAKFARNIACRNSPDAARTNFASGGALGPISRVVFETVLAVGGFDNLALQGQFRAATVPFPPAFGVLVERRE